MLGTNGLGIKLTVRQAPEATLTYADRVQVQLVIVNLVRNAVEAMKDSPRRELLVSVEQKKPMVEFTISDSGTGLSPEIAKRLFQPFVTTKAAGMGLGLSICQSIVHAHGGVISAAANEGGGTIFRFTLGPSPLEGPP
jgi:two-component system sensor kinase FixL